VSFVGRALGDPRAADDARAVRLCDPLEPPPLAFDHGLILHDYLRWRDKGEVAPVRPLPVPDTRK
jgi:8-oxo-dGTP diphosphatase